MTRSIRSASTFALVLAFGIGTRQARAEGSAQVNVPNDQHLQATTNQDLGNGNVRVGQLGVDVLHHATESIHWTGTGSVQIWAPGDDPATTFAVATLASGQSYAPLMDGTYTVEVGSAQAGAWDLSVTGTAPGYGRVSSKAWNFLTGSFAADRKSVV